MQPIRPQKKYALNTPRFGYAFWRQSFALLAAVGCCLKVSSLAVYAAASRPAPADEVRRPLHEVARFYGFPTVSATDDRFTCRSAYSTLEFTVGSRRLDFNGVRLHLNGSVGVASEGWRIDSVDVDMVLDPLLRPARVLAQRPTLVVVLDPGHGGHDLGAVGARNVQEKRVVLDIARRVRAKLGADPFTVHLTRDGDYFVSLPDRVERANDWEADLFVSIHVNGSHNPSVSGIESFVLPAGGYPSTSQTQAISDAVLLPGNRFDAANTLLGYYMQRELLAATNPTSDRGLKRARFAVLKDIQSPAVLIECGFVTNSQEERQMLQAAHRDRLADAIAKAIRAFAARNE